jgi:LysM repeat protein
MEEHQKMLALGGLVVAALVFFLAKKPQSNTQADSTESKSNTVFVPTNSYDIHLVQGDEVNTNTDNRDYSVGGGKVQIPTPPPTTKTKTEYLKLTAKTDAFATADVSGKVITSFAPQTVVVLAKQGDLVQIHTTKGPLWVKPNWQQPKPTDTGGGNKPPVKPATQKTITLTHETDIFSSWKDTTPIGYLAPQTVNVLWQDSGQWVKVQSWKGAVWIVPNKKASDLFATNKPQPPGTPAVQKIDYVVQKGDTLWAISEKFFGDHNHINAIAEMNHISNPNLIITGSHLTIQK